MVPKLTYWLIFSFGSFRAVLFRMVPKRLRVNFGHPIGFRAVLFRMVPKHRPLFRLPGLRFRAVLFRMVPKPMGNVVVLRKVF